MLWGLGGKAGWGGLHVRSGGKGGRGGVPVMGICMLICKVTIIGVSLGQKKGSHALLVSLDGLEVGLDNHFGRCGEGCVLSIAIGQESSHQWCRPL